MPMASGSARPGFFASPPACAIESKPMKLENSTAAAASRVGSDSGASPAGDAAGSHAGGGGEVGLVVREAGDDDDRPQREHQDHERYQSPLVERQAAQVDADEDPQERQGNRHAHGAGVEGGGDGLAAQRYGHVAKERHDDVGDDADGDRQAEPLREAGDEPEVGVERPARVDVAAARPRHRRSEDGVGRGGQQRGDGGEHERREHVRPDAGHVALDHERHDVDAGAEHRADAGRRQPDEPEPALEAARGAHEPLRGA